MVINQAAATLPAWKKTYTRRRTSQSLISMIEMGLQRLVVRQKGNRGKNDCLPPIHSHFLLLIPHRVCRCPTGLAHIPIDILQWEVGSILKGDMPHIYRVIKDPNLHLSMAWSYLVQWWHKICLHQWHLYYINSCNPPTRRHGCDWFHSFCRGTYTQPLCTWEWILRSKACNCLVATAPLTTMQVFHFSEIMKCESYMIQINTMRLKICNTIIIQSVIQKAKSVDKGGG